MLKLFSPLAIAGAFASLTFLGAGPALALSRVTFVSGKGTDTGICSPATPCRSFRFAFDQTTAGGEIKALDPAPYGPVTITKSISITGVEGASINAASGVHITINAGPTDTINLSHLTLDGIKTAERGIVLNKGGSLTISHCTVRNFKNSGIRLQPAGAAKFLITDTLVSDNSFFGIQVFPQGSGPAQGTLDHVSANKNGSGIGVEGTAAVLAVDSTAANNIFEGFFVIGGAVLRLAHSAATGNATGVFVEVGGTAESALNNFIAGNTTNVNVPLTPVGTK